MPGGTAFGGEYGLGMSAVHETGHWLGLSHPFAGGCSEPNDGVSDTAQQSAANYKCAHGVEFSWHCVGCEHKLLPLVHVSSGLRAQQIKQQAADMDVCFMCK